MVLVIILFFAILSSHISIIVLSALCTFPSLSAHCAKGWEWGEWYGVDVSVNCNRVLVVVTSAVVTSRSQTSSQHSTVRLWGGWHGIGTHYTGWLVAVCWCKKGYDKDTLNPERESVGAHTVCVFREHFVQNPLARRNDEEKRREENGKMFFFCAMKNGKLRSILGGYKFNSRRCARWVRDTYYYFIRREWSWLYKNGLNVSEMNPNGTNIERRERAKVDNENIHGFMQLYTADTSK